jgi:hypothetical protein
MATITTWTDKQGYANPFDGAFSPFIAKQRIDCSQVNVPVSDTVQAIKVPAGTYIVNVFVKVITAEGIALTATVGDGAGVNSWDNSADLNAVAGTVTQGVSGTDAYALTGKLYTADDTIDMVHSAAIADAAVYDVIAVGWKIY